MGRKREREGEGGREGERSSLVITKYNVQRYLRSVQ